MVKGEMVSFRDQDGVKEKVKREAEEHKVSETLIYNVCCLVPFVKALEIVTGIENGGNH